MEQTVAPNTTMEVSGKGVLSDMSIRDFLNVVAIKWKWFLISIIICVGLGALYVKRAPKIYSGDAIVLIKDPFYGSPTAGIDLSELGVVSGRSNLDNEIASFTSLDLLMKVCSDLDLDNTYTLQGFRKTELFRQSPVTVTFIDEIPDDVSAGFDFVMRENGDVELSEFTKTEKGETVKYDDEISGRIGTRIKTPLGVVTLTRSSSPGAEKNAGKKIAFRHTNLRSAAISLSGNLSAKSTSKDGTLIGLSVKASSPKKAEAILAAIIDEYNNIWAEDRNAIALATTNFINNRLNVIEKELGNVDNDISSYKSNNLTPDLGEGAKLIMSQSEQLQNKMMELSNQISIAEFIRAELSRDNITEPLPTNVGLESSGVERQIQEYNELVLERNRLLTTVGEKNPISIEKADALRAMKSNILRSSGNLVSSLRTQLRGLQHQDSNYDSRLASSPGQARYLLSAERKQKVQETLYLFLLQKREENEIAQSAPSNNTQIIQSPYSPSSPVSPKSGIILMSAFALGLVIPVSVIYLSILLSTKIHSKSDIESLSAPFMGEIPEDGEHARHDNLFRHILKSKQRRYDSGTIRKIVVRHGNNNIINEAFRVLRTNLEFFGKQEDSGLVMMLTSGYPGSGKTFITTNLGAVLAVKDKRVILVDLDLRKGTLSKLIHSPREGVAQILAGNAALQDCKVRNVEKLEGFDILPAGILPPNPAELMGSPRLKEILDILRKEYDYVVLDCPPIDIVADTQLITPYVDLTLFVIRAGLFDKRMLPVIENNYRMKKYTNLAVVLNGTESSSIYGYKHYGRYGYNYKYQY